MFCDQDNYWMYKIARSITISLLFRLLLGNCHCLYQKWNFKSGPEFHLQNQFLSLKAARHTAVHWSRAHLHQLGVDWDEPSPMKVAVSFSSLVYLQVLFHFLKSFSNTINALLSIIKYSSWEIIEFGICRSKWPLVAFLVGILAFLLLTYPWGAVRGQRTNFRSWPSTLDKGTDWKYTCVHVLMVGGTGAPGGNPHKHK